MISRRHIILLITVLSIALVLPTLLSGMASAASYPPMASGQTMGSVSGKIATTSNTGIANANVSIVNAASTGTVYATTKTDSSGSYLFTGVNSTGGAGLYRIYANASGYSDQYSNPFVVESSSTCTVPNVILSGSGPTATSTVTPCPTPKPGSVFGYVVQAGTGAVIADAKVSLVDGLDASTVYGPVRTDNTGYYRFTDISIRKSPGYRLHVEKDGYYEEYSSPFLAVTETTVKVNQTLTPTPDTSKFKNATVNTVATVGTPSPSVTPAPAATPTATPAPSPTSEAKAGLPIPGFELAAALAGIALACAAARKE